MNEMFVQYSVRHNRDRNFTRFERGLLKKKFESNFFEMASMPFPCNGHLLCCVNIPTVLLMFFNFYCVTNSFRLLKLVI